jgi:uncharacterized membrane protein
MHAPHEDDRPAMMQTPTATPPRETASVRAILAVDRAIYAIARRWLLYVNGAVFLWLALAALAPVLRANGLGGWARAIYALNRPFCHQRDDRSFHLLGEKMACCERCAAIYGGMFLFGLGFLALRGRVRSLPWRGFVLLCLPIAVDALTQMVGLRESTWFLRTVTGSLFGVGLAWLMLPYLETGFADIRAQLERRFARLVAQGRTRPLAGAPPLPPA